MHPSGNYAGPPEDGGEGAKKVLRPTLPVKCWRGDLGHRLRYRKRRKIAITMQASYTFRKLLTAVLVLSLALWAEAGLAIVQPEPAMQCSMSAHEVQAMGDMPCCPGEEMQAPAGGHPLCCSTSDVPERPLTFEISSGKSKAPTLEVVTALVAASAAPAASNFRVWRSADAPRFVKPVLELKTDLRI